MPICDCRFYHAKQIGFLIFWGIKGIFMQIDYYAYRSGMRDWNASLKVSTGFLTLCFVILLDCILTSLIVIFAMGMFTVLLGKIPPKVYFRYLLVPLSFLIISCTAIAVSFSGEPVGDWNLSLYFFYLCLTRESLYLAINVFMKAIAGMSSLFMMAFSTPMNEIILVLQKAHLPRLLTELMNLTYRYIFILFDVAYQMQTAAKARLGCRSFIQSCRSFAAIGGSLFIVSMKKANAYYNALLARGYHGKLEFLTEKKPVQVWQIVCTLFYFAGIVLTAIVW
jgi:cobalt/nickel transport system permease protein